MRIKGAKRANNTAIASTIPAPRPPGRYGVGMATAETPLAKTRRARRISRTLHRAYPDAHTELNAENPYQMVVATILSAQCTDRRVNQVTPALFDRFPGPEDLDNASIDEVEDYIRPTGFYHNKARNLVALGHELVTRFDGIVPDTLTDLVSLPGVGRKTANTVLGNAFGKPGITVDTHFGRLMRRFGLTDATNPHTVEHDIAQLIDKKRWTPFSHEVIIHGRRVCHSRRAACGACFLARDCHGYGVWGPTNPTEAEKLVTGAERDRILELAWGEH